MMIELRKDISNYSGYHFYPVNYSYLEILAKDFSDTFRSLGCSWCEIPEQGMYDILVAAVHTYYFQTHYSDLVYNGRTVPSQDYLHLYAQMLQLPRYVRDMAREFCRPMVSNSILYLPDIRYVMKDEIRVADLFGPVPYLSKFRLAAHKLRYDLVEFLPESPENCPLSFYVSSESTIYSVSQLETWRIEAVGKLKHLVHFEPPMIQTFDGSFIPPPVSHPYEAPIAQSRYAGPTACFQYNVYRLIVRMGLFIENVRFPSPDLYSRTPPKSNRVSSFESKVKTKKETVLQKDNRDYPPLS